MAPVESSTNQAGDTGLRMGGAVLKMLWDIRIPPEKILLLFSEPIPEYVNINGSVDWNGDPLKKTNCIEAGWIMDPHRKDGLVLTAFLLSIFLTLKLYNDEKDQN